MELLEQPWNWRGRLRRMVLGTVAVIGWLGFAASPAVAAWVGNVQRASHNPLSGALVLHVVASAPSEGMHFGLSKAGYTITSVSANQGGLLGGPACTATGQSAVTTRNSGIDCGFASNVSDVIVTFTTTPRYPDHGGGVTYDDNDPVGVTRPVGGPPGQVDTQAIKAIARQNADSRYMSSMSVCEKPTAPSPALGGMYSVLAWTAFYECRDSARALYQSQLAKIDPADHNFHAVAVPRASPSVKAPTCVWSRGHTPPPSVSRVCRALARAAMAERPQTASMASVWSAIDTTLNRLNTAQAAGDQTGVAGQSAALRALEGELGLALARVDASGRSFASALGRARVDVRLTTNQVQAFEQAIADRKPPPTLARALASAGISVTSFSSVVAQVSLPAPAPVDLVRQLRVRVAAGPGYRALLADYRTLTAADLTALVGGLRVGGAISATLSTTLSADAARIATASAGAARRAGVRRFAHDARSAPAGVAALLTVAVHALE